MLEQCKRCCSYCIWQHFVVFIGWLAAVALYVLWFGEEKGPGLVGCHYTLVSLIQTMSNESYVNCHHLGLDGNQHPHLTVSQILALLDMGGCGLNELLLIKSEFKGGCKVWIYQAVPVKGSAGYKLLLFPPFVCMLCSFIFYLICLIPLYILSHRFTHCYILFPSPLFAPYFTSLPFSGN